MQYNIPLFAMLIELLILGTLASGTAAQELQYPLAVVQHPSGAIFVADRNLPGIWKIENGQASVYFQASKKYRTPLNAVRCLALDAQGSLYACESATREIYKFDADGQPQALTKGYIGIPMGIVVNSQGDLMVADLERHCIFQVKPTGEVSEFVKVQGPRGLAMDAQDRLWVLTNTGDALVRFNPDKTKQVLIAGVPFQFANQMVLDKEGNCYFCDGYAHSIMRFAEGGQPTAAFSGEPLKNPVGITYAAENLLIADPHAKAVFSLNLTDSKISAVYPR